MLAARSRVLVTQRLDRQTDRRRPAAGHPVHGLAQLAPVRAERGRQQLAGLLHAERKQAAVDLQHLAAATQSLDRERRLGLDDSTRWKRAGACRASPSTSRADGPPAGSSWTSSRTRPDRCSTEAPAPGRAQPRSRRRANSSASGPSSSPAPCPAHPGGSAGADAARRPAHVGSWAGWRPPAAASTRPHGHAPPRRPAGSTCQNRPQRRRSPVVGRRHHRGGAAAQAGRPRRPAAPAAGSCSPACGTATWSPWPAPPSSCRAWMDESPPTASLRQGLPSCPAGEQVGPPRALSAEDVVEASPWTATAPVPGGGPGTA